MVSTRRVRWTDLTLVLGLVMLLTWTPAYVAGDETQRQWSVPDVFELPPPQIGDKVAFDLVYTWKDEPPQRFPAFRTVEYRAPLDTELPDDRGAAIVEEITQRGVNLELPWMKTLAEGQVQRSYWSDDGALVGFWFEGHHRRTDDQDVPVNETRRSGELRLPLPYDVWDTEVFLSRNVDVRYAPGTTDALVGSIVDDVQHEIEKTFGRGGFDKRLLARAVDRIGDLTLLRADGSSWAGILSDAIPGEPETYTMQENGTTFYGSILDGLPSDTTLTHRISLHQPSWTWYHPDLPVRAGFGIKLTDEAGDVLGSLSVQPMEITHGAGASLEIPAPEYRHWNMVTDYTRQQLPTRDPDTVSLDALKRDTTPLPFGVTLAWLHESVLLDATNEHERSVAERGTIIGVRFFRGVNETAQGQVDRPTPGPLDPPLPTDDSEPIRVAEQATYALAYGTQDGDTAVAVVSVQRTDAGTVVRDVRPGCGQSNSGTPSHCIRLAQGVLDPERHGMDLAWFLREQQRLTEGTLDHFLYRPDLFLARNDESLAYHWSAPQAHDNHTTAPSYWFTEYGGNWTSRPTVSWRDSLSPDRTREWRLDGGDGTLMGVSWANDGPGGAPLAPSQAPETMTSASLPQALEVHSTTVALAGLALVAISLSARILSTVKSASPLLFFTPLFSRIANHDAVLNERRSDILAAVEADPGITPRELQDRLGYGWGATVHHVETLVRTGHLVRIQNGQRRHFFVPDTPEQDRLEKALRRDGVYATVLDATTDGATVDDLIEATNRSRTGLVKITNRLVRLGLMKKQRQGRNVLYVRA